MAINIQSLAPSRGAVCQAYLTTLPLLGVLCYFLFLAHQRPNLPRYNLTDDADEYQVATANADSLIAIIEMLYVFLSIVPMCSWFLLYLVVFVPKRHLLIKQYMDKASGVKSVLGDVNYEEYNRSWIRRCNASFFRADYACVTYTIDRETCNNDESDKKLFFHSWRSGTDATDKEIQAGKKNSEFPNDDSNVTDVLIQKKIRTFFPFDREQISVLVLPNKPRSGIPQADIETHISTQDTRSQMSPLMWLLVFWNLFLVFGAFYLVKQMEKVSDIYEDDALGWALYTTVIGIITPVTSIGFNWIKHMRYKKFLENQGVEKPVLDEKSVSENYVRIQ